MRLRRPRPRGDSGDPSASHRCAVDVRGTAGGADGRLAGRPATENKLSELRTHNKPVASAHPRLGSGARDGSRCAPGSVRPSRKFAPPCGCTELPRRPRGKRVSPSENGRIRVFGTAFTAGMVARRGGPPCVTLMPQRTTFRRRRRASPSQTGGFALSVTVGRA